MEEVQSHMPKGSGRQIAGMPYVGMRPTMREFAGGAAIDTANIIQKLDFSMDADKQYLLDVSGNGNNGLLVQSNCFLGNNVVNFSSISTDPVADNMKFYDFSVEFWFSVAATTGYQVMIGRTTGALTKNLLSAFVCDGGKLKYYSGNDTTNVTVDIIASVSTNTVYHVLSSVVNSTGNIAWIVNGVAGSSTFSNKTPQTNQTNDLVRINGVMNAGSPYYYLQNNGKLFGVKYYTSVNYANLSHYWPIAEGGGTTVYDIVGSKNLTLATASWSTQDSYHYNLTKGFQLYGNSDANNSLIRVPYNNDGTTKSPTISGYTKFSDCPAGAFHNFAETGVKRNYNSVAALTSAGISSTNVVYYGGVTGYSGYAYCKNHMGEETDYTVFSTSKDRYAAYGNKSYSRYMDDTVTKVLVAGSTGKIHSTNFKNCINRTVSASVYYDMFIRNGTYTLTTTSELSIVIPAKCGIIGESRTACIVNGYLPANTAKATLEAISTFHTNGTSFRLGNLYGTAKNMRYVVHDDGDVLNPVKKYWNAKFEHLGNDEARAIDPTIIDTCDAIGTGYQDGLNLTMDNVDAIGYGVKGRGYAAHFRWEHTYATKAVLNMGNSNFSSTGGTYSFRWAAGPTETDDEVHYNNCSFNNQPIYLDAPSAALIGDAYSPNADRMKFYLKSGNTPPSTYNASPNVLLGLKLAVASNKTLEVVAGTTATLLLGVVKTLNSYSATGRKEISEVVTGAVALNSLLGNCSSTNKTLVVKIDGVNTNVVFNQNYSAMTNAQVLASINTILSGLTFSQYSFGDNVEFISE